MKYTNYYRCPCGEEWDDEWSCACNDRCPACNKEVTPYISDDGTLFSSEIEFARVDAIAMQTQQCLEAFESRKEGAALCAS